MEQKALFIHGLHSDCDSTTGSYVAEILKNYGYETIHPYGFVVPFESLKIIINPCLKPEIEIPPLLNADEKMPENLIQDWQAAWDRNCRFCKKRITFPTFKFIEVFLFLPARQKPLRRLAFASHHVVKD